MASKMENYLAWLSRHTTPAEFAARIAGDVKVQAYLASQSRLSDAERELERMQRAVLTKVMRPALDRASKWLAIMEKNAAGGVRETGTLQQAIGSVPAKIYQATFCGWVASGVRRGYARAVTAEVTAKGKIKLKRHSKKNTALLTATRKRIPAAYARFVMKGRGPVTSKKNLGPALGGRFFGHSVKAAPPKNFMGAAESAAPQAAAIAAQEMNDRLAAL